MLDQRPEDADNGPDNSGQKAIVETCKIFVKALYKDIAGAVAEDNDRILDAIPERQPITDIQVAEHIGITQNVLIGLMQLGTRCSDGSCEAAEDLISGFSAIEAEAELVQIGLKLCAAAVISAEQECFQVADGFVQPVQVARFILFRVQLHARQVLIASVAVAFDFCTCRNSFADDLLKCFARDVFHDLHPREQRSPVFRF